MCYCLNKVKNLRKESFLFFYTTPYKVLSSGLSCTLFCLFLWPTGARNTTKIHILSSRPLSYYIYMDTHDTCNEQTSLYILYSSFHLYTSERNLSMCKLNLFWRMKVHYIGGDSPLSHTNERRESDGNLYISQVVDQRSCPISHYMASLRH